MSFFSTSSLLRSTGTVSTPSLIRSTSNKTLSSLFPDVNKRMGFLANASSDRLHQFDDHMYTVVNGVQNTADVMQNEAQNLYATVQV